MDTNLFAKMDDPEVFKKFKIILLKEGKTVKQVANEWVAKTVKENGKNL